MAQFYEKTIYSDGFMRNSPPMPMLGDMTLEEAKIKIQRMVEYQKDLRERRGDTAIITLML